MKEIMMKQKGKRIIAIIACIIFIIFVGILIDKGDITIKIGNISISGSIEKFNEKLIRFGQSILKSSHFGTTVIMITLIVILGIIVIQIIKTVRMKIKQENETERTKIKEMEKTKRTELKEREKTKRTQIQYEYDLGKKRGQVSEINIIDFRKRE